MPFLVIRYPEKQKTWRVRVDAQQFSIGRGPEATVRLPHSSISKEHVLIECRGARSTFRDLGSHNGILVGGMRVERGPLNDGDTLQLGPFEVRFWKQDPPADELAEPKLPEAPGADSIEKTTTYQRLAPATDESTAEGDAERASSRAETAGTGPEPVGRPGQPGGAHGSPSPPRAPLPNATASAANELRAPSAQRRRWSPSVVTALVLLCMASGIGLGYLGTWVDDSRPDATSEEANTGERTALEPGSDEEEGVVVRRAGRPVNPLGEPLAPADGAVWHAALVRLWLDARERPPLPFELRRTMLLSLEDRWVKLAGEGFGESLATAKPPDVFKRMLRRAPEEAELAALLELAREDPEHLAFLLSSSHEYARPRSTRRRDPRRLARSLLVDLTGRVPTLDEEDEIAERLERSKDEADEVDDIAVDLTQRSDSRAGPEPGVSDPAWVRDVFHRMLLRGPTEKELRTSVAAVRHDEDGWRLLLGSLARRKEYLSY